MKKNYIAKLAINDELETITYSTEGNPIDYLWARYGMSTYIDSVEEEKDDLGEATEEESKEVLEETETNEEENIQE